MSKLLMHCDMFGYKPCLQIKNSNSLKTVLGATVSLIVIALIITSIWIFGKDVILREEPSVITTTYNDPDPLRINLTDDNFMFALGMTYANKTYFIDDRIVTINAQRITALRNGDGSQELTVEDIEIEPCSRKNISVIPEYFKNMNLSTLLCMKNGTTYITGDWGQREYTYLHFGFSRCKNTTENNNHCLSKEEASLEGGYISMYMSDNLIIPTNFSYPFISYGKNMYDTVSDNIYKEFNIYLETLQISSDKGWLLKDISHESNFKVYKTKSMWDFRNTTGTLFYSLNFRCSLERLLLSRKYVKLQDISASVGGVSNFLFILGEMLVYYFGKLQFNEYMTEVFSNMFDSEGEMGDRKNDSGLKLDKGRPDTQFKKNITAHTLSLSISNTDSKQQSDTHKYYKLSFCEKLFSHCCKSKSLKKKLDRINFIQGKLKNNFDWVYFINFQNEVLRSLQILLQNTNQYEEDIQDKKLDDSNTIQNNIQNNNFLTKSMVELGQMVVNTTMQQIKP